MATIDEILAHAGSLVDEAEIYFVEAVGISATLKKDEISSTNESRNCSLSLRIIDRGRIGASATNDPGRWKDCLDAAIGSSRISTPQPWGGLPGMAPLDPSPLNYDPGLIPDITAVRELLEGLREGAGAHPAKITHGEAEIIRQTATLANTHGLSYSLPESRVSVSLETISGQSTGYEFDSAARRGIDAGKVGERAAYLAAASVNGREIPSGTYDIVLSPIAFAQLIGSVLIPSLSGRNVHAGRSRLGPLLGEEITDTGISIYDDPFRRDGLGSTRWDAEGTPTKKTSFITKGVLDAFAYDLRTAYRYRKTSSGSAVRPGSGGMPSIGGHNIVIEGVRQNILDEKVLFVHDVVGAHTANPLSGDFSVELSNTFMVEGGSFEFPIRKAMFSGNVFDMLRDSGGLGKTDRIIGSLILPSIRLKNQHIIGT